jgi:hypothetical protein
MVVPAEPARAGASRTCCRRQLDITARILIHAHNLSNEVARRALLVLGRQDGAV